MNKPKTQLGNQVARMFKRNGDEYEIVDTSPQYDTFRIEVADHQEMDVICHEYPSLAHGILFHSRSIYPLGDCSLSTLVQIANNANLKTTATIVSIEHRVEDDAFIIHFKSFTHLDPAAINHDLINEALDLQMTEIDEIILPLFKRPQEGVNND